MFEFLNKIQKNLTGNKTDFNSDSLKIIEVIINEFTSDELKFLEINKNGKVTTFAEIMIAEYGRMLPKFLPEKSKEEAQKIIDVNRDQFKKDLNFNVADFFIQEFLIFFVEKE